MRVRALASVTAPDSLRARVAHLADAAGAHAPCSSRARTGSAASRRGPRRTACGTKCPARAPYAFSSQLLAFKVRLTSRLRDRRRQARTHADPRPAPPHAHFHERPLRLPVLSPLSLPPPKRPLKRLPEPASSSTHPRLRTFLPGRDATIVCKAPVQRAARGRVRTVR